MLRYLTDVCGPQTYCIRIKSAVLRMNHIFMASCSRIPWRIVDADTFLLWRLVRTRMPGGVAGARPMKAPVPILVILLGAFFRARVCNGLLLYQSNPCVFRLTSSAAWVWLCQKRTKCSNPQMILAFSLERWRAYRNNIDVSLCGNNTTSGRWKSLIEIPPRRPA